MTPTSVPKNLFPSPNTKKKNKEDKYEEQRYQEMEEQREEAKPNALPENKPDTALSCFDEQKVYKVRYPMLTLLISAVGPAVTTSYGQALNSDSERAFAAFVGLNSLVLNYFLTKRFSFRKLASQQRLLTNRNDYISIVIPACVTLASLHGIAVGWLAQKSLKEIINDETMVTLLWTTAGSASAIQRLTGLYSFLNFLRSFIKLPRQMLKDILTSDSWETVLHFAVTSVGVTVTYEYMVSESLKDLIGGKDVSKVISIPVALTSLIFLVQNGSLYWRMWGNSYRACHESCRRERQESNASNRKSHSLSDSDEKNKSLDAKQYKTQDSPKKGCWSKCCNKVKQCWDKVPPLLKCVLISLPSALSAWGLAKAAGKAAYLLRKDKYLAGFSSVSCGVAIAASNCYPLSSSDLSKNIGSPLDSTVELKNISSVFQQAGSLADEDALSVVGKKEKVAHGVKLSISPGGGISKPSSDDKYGLIKRLSILTAARDNIFRRIQFRAVYHIVIWRKNLMNY